MPRHLLVAKPHLPFDFQEDAREPRVIHFDDAYSPWRRSAPDFEALIRLFEPYVW
jgi:hypothetical protein